jgi:hypothetical protein
MRRAALRRKDSILELIEIRANNVVKTSDSNDTCNMHKRPSTSESVKDASNPQVRYTDSTAPHNGLIEREREDRWRTYPK